MLTRSDIRHIFESLEVQPKDANPKNWDNIDNIETFKGYDFFTYQGATKGVLVAESFTENVIRVFKFTFATNEWDDEFSYDYCKREWKNYKTITEYYPEVAGLFARIKPITMIGGVVIYEQEYIQSIEYKLSGDSKYWRRGNLPREYITDKCTPCCAFLNYLILAGMGDYIDPLCETTMDLEINDIHTGNVGLDINNNPKIFDYSGFID